MFISFPMDTGLLIQSSLLLDRAPTVRHAFGTLTQPIPTVFLPREEWEKQRPKWKQVHGTRLVAVHTPSQECGEADALSTDTPSQSLAVVTADCVPILLTKKDGSAVCAIHAGWRGTFAEIVKKSVHFLEAQYKTSMKEWIAAIGPAAGPCCYEVSQELIDQFTEKFGPISLASPSNPRNLNLPKINQEALYQTGVREVEILSFCTICSVDPKNNAKRFHSYRRDQKQAGRQYSLIQCASLSEKV